MPEKIIHSRDLMDELVEHAKTFGWDFEYDWTDKAEETSEYRVYARPLPAGESS